MICRAGGRPGALLNCKSCHGRGIKVTTQQLGPGMVQQFQTMCPDCHGEGIVMLILTETFTYSVIESAAVVVEKLSDITIVMVVVGTGFVVVFKSFESG